MANRTFTWVLGDSSLEWKIRILFGLITLLLVALAFFSVLQISEDMIRNNTRTKASELIETHLTRVHYTSTEFIANEFAADLKGISDGLTRTRDYEASVLRLTPDHLRNLINARLVDDPEEVALLASLEVQYLPVQRDLDRSSILADNLREAADNPSALLRTNQTFPDRFLPDNQFAYYEPVIFTPVCVKCHYAYRDPASGPDPALAEAVAPEAGLPDGEQLPETRKRLAAAEQVGVCFVRIMLPYRAAKRAINRTRAILLAVGIGTVFLSTLALYLIVRLVIVRPLKHLRDVADQVSQGNLALRSSLETGDEFEQLGRSFNRMLRHLMDTQDQLREANDDLDHKVIQQAQMNFKLHEMNKLKSEFLATMSHELRTPLNSIIGFSEVLESVDVLAEREKKFASNIRRSGRMLLDVINDILDLARLEAGRMEISPTEFSIGQLVGEQCELVRNLAEQRSIMLRCDVDSELPLVYQDQLKIRQILNNLLSNAIKFTPEGGRIRVTARRSGDGMLELAVEDSGVGIPENELTIIFEKFRQGPRAIGGDNLTREVSGTGLGLSIVRELCGLLGGTIGVVSEVGQGSTFTVRLPWQVPPAARRESDVALTLEELSRSRRLNLVPGEIEPVAVAPAAASGSQVAPPTSSFSPSGNSDHGGI
jgi:two-component system, NarL family, sensor histidine kinase BarA